MAACARAGSPTLPNDATQARQGDLHSATATFKHLLSFNGSDGKAPDARLVDAGGVLYGTAYSGGVHDEGAVFAFTTSGKLTVLHNFKGDRDGSLPLASLLSVNGTLYGTTVNGGGANGEGVVFAVTSSGAESVVHRFSGGSDGANPYAGLVNLNGTLYGTTAGGGSSSAGTVYTISTSGKETVIYEFGHRQNDGATPVASLTEVGSTLYGTTEYGGTGCGSSGCGTIFKISKSGSESVVYAFKGGSKDGSQPSSSLVDLNGTLYGTTTFGGAANAGIVFKVSPAGAERIVYNFQGGTKDGAEPQGLSVLKGTLYGTTFAGGSSNLGTLFALTTAGKESLIHTFKGGIDGAMPRAPLFASNGTLYGTTAAGGGNQAGTIFSITP